MADTINDYGVNVSHFARKVHAWAVAQSEHRGREVTFWEAFARWCDYVHPHGRRIADETRD